MGKTVRKDFAELIFVDYLAHVCLRLVFVGINVHGTHLISKNRESLYPRNIPAIRYNYMLNSYVHLYIQLDSKKYICHIHVAHTAKTQHVTDLLGRVTGNWYLLSGSSNPTYTVSHMDDIITVYTCMYIKCCKL